MKKTGELFKQRILEYAAFKLKLLRGYAFGRGKNAEAGAGASEAAEACAESSAWKRLDIKENQVIDKASGEVLLSLAALAEEALYSLENLCISLLRRPATVRKTPLPQVSALQRWRWICRWVRSAYWISSMSMTAEN